MPAPLVVLHGQDPEHAAVLAHEMDALIDGVEVQHAPTADDLGRLLTDDDVAVLVATVRDGERGWNRLHLIRDALPDLVIVACVGPGEARGRIAQRHRDAVNAIVADSIPNEQLVATVRRVSGLHSTPRPDSSLGEQSWAVVGLAGGVGTTTLATLVAGQLARQRWTVLCDLDLRHGAVAAAVRAEPRYTLADLVNGDPEQMREAALACIHPLDTGVGLLAGPDEGTSSITWTPERAREVVRAVARPTQILVADHGDLPRRWYPALDEYSDIVVVSSHDIRCARRVGPACRLLEEVAPASSLHVVLNAAMPGLTPSPAELESVMGRSWDAVVPELDAVRVAHNDVSGNGLNDLVARMPRELSAAVSSIIGTSVAAAMRRRFRRHRSATELRRTS